jgi:hypothetical protein
MGAIAPEDWQDSFVFSCSMGRNQFVWPGFDRFAWNVRFCKKKYGQAASTTFI